MGTELARAFLTVITSGSFISAADRLHVNQSTVSTRIHTLEDQLGCTGFVRDKAGTTLTSAGRQFQKHAATLIRTTKQAAHRKLCAGHRWTIWPVGRIPAEVTSADVRRQAGDIRSRRERSRTGTDARRHRRQD